MSCQWYIALVSLPSESPFFDVKQLQLRPAQRLCQNSCQLVAVLAVSIASILVTVIGAETAVLIREGGKHIGISVQ